MQVKRRGRGEPGAHGSEAKAAEDRHIGFRWLARNARLPEERDAEMVFRAVSRELGDCTGARGARHIASHLPLGLRLIWEEETLRAGRPSGVSVGVVVSSLRARLGLAHPAEAEFLLGLVCGWLKHLAPEEREDVTAVLSPGVRALWEGARLPDVPPWRSLVLGVSRNSRA